MLITGTHHFFSLVPQHLLFLPTPNSSSSLFTSALCSTKSHGIPSGSSPCSPAGWALVEMAGWRDLTGVKLAWDRTSLVWSEPALLLLSAFLSFFIWCPVLSLSLSHPTVSIAFLIASLLVFSPSSLPSPPTHALIPMSSCTLDFDRSKCAAELFFTRAYFCKHTYTTVHTRTQSQISYALLCFHITSLWYNKEFICECCIE